MVSDVIPVRHLFTTRFGGVSKGDLASLNVGSNRGDDPECVRENYRRVCSYFGCGEDDACVTGQLHGNIVRTMTFGDRHICLSKVPYEADGIVSFEKGLPLMCFTADCIPALLCDKAGTVAAAVHCGWRSSVSDILKNAVEAMKADPSEICCALGPSIGPCCFETDADVADAVVEYIGEKPFVKRGDKYFVDLKEANRIRLLQLGLKDENIDVSSECTVCSHDKYWSHRYTTKNGLARGTQTAAIML